uniref:Leucine rich repeat containing 43 n=1 Tax=Podarcis muralis TaxID=64176 RepID=A0A670JVX1_PODMU
KQARGASASEGCSAMAGPGAASAAFWEHLRRLCLDQFPCGIGSWNKSRFPPRKATVSPRWALPKARASPRDGFLPPEEESVESLTDYLRSLGSPWALPADCSPEDQQLRELAVQAPRDIQDSLIFSYFKSLRIVNKNVIEIDADLLKFPNLEELILSANHISKINSSNLPPTLKGNPLALLPGYRGFVIDSLPKLCTLDDVIITPDERHDFLELSSNPGELLKCYTKMVVVIGKVRGVPNPIGSEEPETGPEAPIITYNYYVTYEFAKDEKIEEEETDKVDILEMEEESIALLVFCPWYLPAPPAPQRWHMRECDLTFEVSCSEDVLSSKALRFSPLGNVYSTPRKPWAEVIDCDHTKEHVTRDMVALKAYLLAGTTVTVVEEKVVSWPVVLTPNESPTKKGKDKGKGGKKKKSPSPELRSDPPIVKVLGSGHVNLESLLAGEPLVETVCDFGILITESTSKPPSPKEKPSQDKSSQRVVVIESSGVTRPFVWPLCSTLGA